MESLLFEQIDNAELIADGFPNIDAVSKMTAIDIVEFTHQSPIHYNPDILHPGFPVT